MQLLKAAFNIFLAAQATNAFTFIGAPISRQTGFTNTYKSSLIVLSSEETATASGPTPYVPGSLADDADDDTSENDAVETSAAVVVEEPVSVAEPEPELAPARSRPDRNVIEENKVYIGNLSYEMDEVSLKEIFDEFGEVQEISLPVNRETGSIRGFGFITFEDKETADTAIQALQGKEILGRQVYVNTAGAKAPARPTRKDVAGTKLYVGNLSFDTTLDELKAYFENFGTVLDAYMPTDRETREPRGFAFVTMSDEEALGAIEQTNDYEFNGRTLKVNKSLKRGEKPPPKAPRVTGTKLYVGNLSYDTEQDTLESFFSEFGSVIDCYMPQDRNTGRTRGFAFVTMAEGDAMNAIDQTDGYELDGRHLRVNEAQPKGSFSGSNRGDDWSNDGGSDSWDSSDDSWDNSDDSWDTDDSTWDTE